MMPEGRLIVKQGIYLERIWNETGSKLDAQFFSASYKYIINAVFLIFALSFSKLTIHLPNRVICFGTNSSTYHRYIDRSWNQTSSENFNNYNIKLIPGLD